MPKKIKLEHKPLHCPLCAKRFMNLFGQPLPNHAEIKCETIAGDVMYLGICQDCIEKGVTVETCKAVLEGIKDYWCFDVDANKNIKASEKKAIKEKHCKHEIKSVLKIDHTGANAEKEARKKKLLL